MYLNYSAVNVLPFKDHVLLLRAPHFVNMPACVGSSGPLSSTAAQQPWVGLGHLKQMSPVTTPGHLPFNFYNPVSLCLSLPRKSILISVSHVRIDLRGLSIISFWVVHFHPFTQHSPPTSVYWILLC